MIYKLIRGISNQDVGHKKVGKAARLAFSADHLWLYQKAGMMKEWTNQKDQGRFEVTKEEIDKMFFKVPSLRNIAKTASYFHDGSAPDLPTAIKTMAEHQIGKQLDETTINSIIAFLESLTGTPPADLITPPVLPASTAKTPKPIP